MFLLLILAVGSWAREMAPTSRAAHPTAGACACVSSPICWKLVEAAYAINIDGALTEVEGSLPNRFMPGTEFSALRRTDKDGHFLSATCGPKKQACTEKRDALEKNLVFSRFLASLPLGQSNGELFDSQRWTLTDEGLKTIDEARRCKPNLLRLLADVVQKHNRE